MPVWRPPAPPMGSQDCEFGGGDRLIFSLSSFSFLASGCWVVRPEWVLRSLSEQQWLPEETYEVLRFSFFFARFRVLRARGVGLRIDSRPLSVWQNVRSGSCSPAISMLPVYVDHVAVYVTACLRMFHSPRMRRCSTSTPRRASRGWRGACGRRRTQPTTRSMVAVCPTGLFFLC